MTHSRPLWHLQNALNVYQINLSQHLLQTPIIFLNALKYQISFQGYKVWNDFLTNQEKEIKSYILFSKTIKSKLTETEQGERYF